MSGTYEANPAGLQTSSGNAGGLSAHARKIGDDFLTDQSNYRGLNGYSDDFHDETQPRYEANNDSILSAVRAFEGVFVGLESAISGNRRNILSTQEGANDLIHQQSSKLDGLEGGERR
ncbi:hypothetical protein PV396_13605 [Streptomyces sp. ME02-8801-2C]|uniref:hypothetical protein n=1 Tax=Streptomyces sp. ME02-8801-2C TaxID=3028680 RepID=UPI0029AE94FE|nr:hypothetical protein [Streptomyces sp. ME02-8801-2C]MDX3452974.1 hypothetical protein [Streptomyces sp. ME02-8801-2C]